MKKNEINQTGTGNIAFSDINDSEFNIFIGKSYQYNELLEQLKTQERLFSLIPKDETEERLKTSQKIQALKGLIEQFKRDVLQLTAQFDRVEINTDRLRRAREFFDKGEFGEARAVLETELEQMQDEQTLLLAKREEYETDTLPKLRSNAEQFFILGLLTQLDYSNPNWFDDTCCYYEQSIKSYPTKDNVFDYAVFLWRHNRVKEAEKYYQRYLSDFAAMLSLAERAGALNNLGLLRWDSNEYEKGLAESEEALEILKKLSKDEPTIYLPKVAGTLNNIAMFHNELNDVPKALKEYKEALRIYRQLANENSFPDYLLQVADVLNNLGSLNIGINTEVALVDLEESLKIYREVSDATSLKLPFQIATTLHNLGNLYCHKKEYEKGLVAYEEALSIRMDEAKTNPLVYLPEASCTLSVLSRYHIKHVPNREKSIECALDTIMMLISIYEQVPFTQPYFQGALMALRHWELNEQEIQHLIEERIKD